MNRGAVAGVAADVRSGSLADIRPKELDVRFTPKSGHWLSALGCPLCAKSRHSAAQQNARRAPGKFGGLHTMLGVPLSCGGDLSEFDDRRNLRLSSRLPARRCKPN